MQQGVRTIQHNSQAILKGSPKIIGSMRSHSGTEKHIPANGIKPKTTAGKDGVFTGKGSLSIFPAKSPRQMASRNRVGSAQSEKHVVTTGAFSKRPCRLVERLCAGTNSLSQALRRDPSADGRDEFLQHGLDCLIEQLEALSHFASFEGSNRPRHWSRSMRARSDTSLPIFLVSSKVCAVCTSTGFPLLSSLSCWNRRSHSRPKPPICGVLRVLGQDDHHHDDKKQNNDDDRRFE